MMKEYTFAYGRGSKTFSLRSSLALCFCFCLLLCLSFGLSGSPALCSFSIQSSFQGFGLHVFPSLYSCNSCDGCIVALLLSLVTINIIEEGFLPQSSVLSVTKSVRQRAFIVEVHVYSPFNALPEAIPVEETLAGSFVT